MMKLFFFFVVGALAISGAIAVLTRQTPTSTTRQEVPERPSLRVPASVLAGSSSQVSALSVRPTTGTTGGLNITEAQIRLMEENLRDLQQDISLFKDTEGWVVRFHHTSSIMTALGVKDSDLISFKQLQEVKKQPALESLVRRLEIIFAHLQK
jgi:hypothetical protein